MARHQTAQRTDDNLAVLSERSPTESLMPVQIIKLRQEEHPPRAGWIRL